MQTLKQHLKSLSKRSQKTKTVIIIMYFIYYRHRSITVEENGWITQNKTFSYMKKIHRFEAFAPVLNEIQNI